MITIATAVSTLLGSFYMFVKKFAMSGLHPLQVEEIQRLTDDAVTISFSIPKELVQKLRSFQQAHRHKNHQSLVG